MNLRKLRLLTLPIMLPAIGLTILGTVNSAKAESRYDISIEDDKLCLGILMFGRRMNFCLNIEDRKCPPERVMEKLAIECQSGDKDACAALRKINSAGCTIAESDIQRI